MKMSLLYSGRLAADPSDINGVTVQSLAHAGEATPKAYPGYICDLKIPSGKLGLITNVGESITAFRIVTVRLGNDQLLRFLFGVRSRRRRFLVHRLRLHCKVAKSTFERYLKEGGIDYLALGDLKAEPSWRRAHDLIATAAVRCKQPRQPAQENAANNDASIVPSLDNDAAKNTTSPFDESIPSG